MEECGGFFLIDEGFFSSEVFRLYEGGACGSGLSWWFYWFWGCLLLNDLTYFIGRTILTGEMGFNVFCEEGGFDGCAGFELKGLGYFFLNNFLGGGLMCSWSSNV